MEEREGDANKTGKSPRVGKRVEPRGRKGRSVERHFRTRKKDLKVRDNWQKEKKSTHEICTFRGKKLGVMLRGARPIGSARIKKKRAEKH